MKRINIQGNIMSILDRHGETDPFQRLVPEARPLDVHGIKTTVDVFVLHEIISAEKRRRINDGSNGYLTPAEILSLDRDTFGKRIIEEVQAEFQDLSDIID
jgi:hypothetical protein